MTKTISAIDYVQTTFPPTEGERLACALLEERLLSEDLQIDLTDCPPALLISAFFNGFLQHVYEQSADHFDAAKQVRWNAEFDFQNENIQDWVRNFEPREVTQN